MFSHQFYNVVHIVGIVLAIAALGAATMLGSMRSGDAPKPERRLIGIMHGLGLFLVLLGGFGMLARLGIIHGGSFPAWVWAKIVIWLIVGALLVVPYRRPELARLVLVALPVLAGLAAWLAIYKPI